MNIAERYEMVEKEHGEGGFAKVSKQRDKILERLVAVKTLTLLDDEDSKARIIKEAKTLAAVSHSNIPAIYDVIFDEKEMTIFFQFIEGQSLQKIITDGAYPSMEEAKQWFIQVASALEHSHSRGIIHRDVKPSNIIISEK